MKTISTILFALTCTALASCGGDDGGGDDAPDAAGGSAITSVSCAGATLAATVTTSGSAYSPQSSTIAAGGIVRFDPSATHNVSGEGFDVPLGGEGCFQFSEAGTFGFSCTPHGFTGSIIVQ